MMYLIPLRRLGVDVGVLEKAASSQPGFSRGPKPGHKYVRREFIGYVKGRARWRYWYRDDKSMDAARTGGASGEEAESEHQHALVKDLVKVFKNLADKMIPPSSVNEQTLEEKLEPTGRDVKFKIHPKFYQRHHAPFVKAEKDGEELTRTPLTRVMRALEMVPPEMAEWLGKSNLKEIEITPYDDGKHEDKVNKWAGYAHYSGKLVLLAGDGGPHGSGGAFGQPHGYPRYGSQLTWTESVVWHEMGHHIHWALEKHAPEVWADWKAISAGYSKDRISDYAHTNVHEDFAESIAAMLAHPKQMAQQCPQRYDFFRKHGIISGPSREEILKDVSDESLEWWRGKQISNAGKLAAEMKLKTPTSYIDVYQSPKDQFYSLMYKGRQLYFRAGPKDRSEEEGWEPIGATVDPETGLPVFDVNVSARFQAKGSIKEIYDENGNALTQEQALLWLRQDDEDFAAKLPENLEDFEKMKAADRATLNLPYQIFIALGERRGDQTAERERVQSARAKGAKQLETLQKRLDKLTAKGPKEDQSAEEHQAKVDDLRDQIESLQEAIKSGSDFASLKRHQFAPHEMSAAEFNNATPTFKFGALREAAEQPYLLKQWDPKLRRPIPVVARNPVTGKDEPVRASTVYEMENPDGTKTRIQVSETDPFSPGDTILVPQMLEKKLSDGTVIREQEWAPFKIPQTMDVDPSKVAREFGTTVEELLRRNNRYGKGQIADPLLANLLNPSGQRIRSSGDLIGLMRDAAKRGATAWVTVQSGDPSKPSNAHIKVRFDGGGNPVIEGEYWPRRFGLPLGCRLDQIIDKKNSVKIDRIVETKPRKVPAQLGSVVSYRDPKTGREVLGTITAINVDEATKKKEYAIKPVKGQGTGLMKRPVVSKVKAITDDIVPGQPGVRRRSVRPLKSDVLLYLDNLKYERVSSTGKPEGKVISGVIKIQPPLDGSITAEELTRLPGVRTIKSTDPVTGEEVTEMMIDRRDISTLREAFGGFVMDRHVTQILDELASNEKKRAQSARKRDVVAVTQLTQADGTVNTEEGGLLQGLRATTPDGKPFKLGSHQVDFLQACARAEGRLMAAHFMGTGKTVSALAAIQMMKNAKDPNDPSKPVPGSPRKKVCIVVPLNTITQWESATSFFTNGAATVIGANTLAGAQQAFKWPERKANESDEAYMARVREMRAAKTAADPQLWNPERDNNDIVVIPFEYFRDNEHDLRAFGDFDGIVVDEAHAIARENELSKAVERWNPSMNMMLLLTGTPVTNRLNTLPRIVDLLSKGRSPLGSDEDFKERYLVESQVMVAHGAKKPPKTDINPQLAGELGSILQQYLHVATTEDVKGKTMPAVLLDENQPAHMQGIQEQMYRAAMASLTDEDRERLEQSAAIGLDEMQMLSPQARKKVNIARSFANSPGYKAPSAQEFLTYMHQEAKKTRKGTVEVTESPVVFTLPDFDTIMRKKPEGWDGKWPSLADLKKGRIQAGYFAILTQIATQMTKTDYEKLAGKKISKEHLNQIRGGSLGGIQWGKVPNPEYGPEGSICRGVLQDGSLQPVTVEHNGEAIEVPVGMRFVRDPNKKAAGLYYAESDWDFSGSVDESTEGDSGDSDESEEEAGVRAKKDGDGGKKKGKKKGSQSPKAGMEEFTLQRHPGRRRERAMFDAVMTQGNAKCDELERYMLEKMNTATGGNPDAQFILFGNRIGSSCRTMESKMRLMGYMDVNEALGASGGYSSDEDKARRPKMGYFVTYFGKGATLGDRDINSEIFRKVKDQLGRDTETSMLVHRTLTGSVGKAPNVGEFKEGWSRAERDRIKKLFAGPDGSPNVEIPMRVTRKEDGALAYVYESDIKDKKGGRADLTKLRDLERQRNGAPPEEKAKYESQMNAIFAKYVTDRAPLSQHQMDVFNNCKVMVASDAAQVGLNWGNASELVMYDSLHSPMLEWQRITRAARMLDAIIPDKAQPIFDKLREHISAMEKRTGFAEYKNLESAIPIVQEAYDQLTPAEQNAATQMGFDPVVAAEAYFAKTAFDKITSLRQTVKDQLRTVGRELEPVERVNPNTGAVEIHRRFVKPQEVTSSDVMNEIVEKHLTPFEREILKSRKYLVHVKRLTTSVNMPEFAMEANPVTGKSERVATGNYYTEVPSRAEQAQLTQGRSKQVPYEAFLKMVQDAHEVKTDYDFINAGTQSLGHFSVLPKEVKKAVLPRFFIEV